MSNEAVEVGRIEADGAELEMADSGQCAPRRRVEEGDVITNYYGI